jgi:hypothetical protein
MGSEEGSTVTRPIGNIVLELDRPISINPAI